MWNVVIIGTGGFIGAVLRYALSGAFQKAANNHWFPFGTLGVNLIGCLIIGALGGFAENLKFFSSEVRLFLFLGILGSFTTFSTFGHETLILLRERAIGFAFLNVFTHIFIGLFAVWAGYAIVTAR